MSEQKITPFRDGLNIDLFERIKKALREEPRRAIMNDWITDVDPKDQRNPPCGTVGCIAGHAILLEKKQDEPGAYSKRAEELLGLTEYEGSLLFFYNHWPIHIYREALHYDEQTPQFVEVMCQRIDHFIHTGE